MREVRLCGAGQIGKPPSFGRKMTAQELEEIRPLVKRDHRLPETLVDSLSLKYCSVMDSPAGKLGMFLKFPLLAAEAVADMGRTYRSLRAYRKSGGTEPVMSLQWVRFPKSKSDSLEFSVPCKGDSCPMTKDGKPATGRAILGKDMISWKIYET